MGIVYKLINYADNSAIACLFTKDFGKIKFFINKAFTSKGGIHKFIPGEIDFLKKDNTDLNKFYAFHIDIKYMYFLENIDIYYRLHLVFEIIDYLYELESKDVFLWKLLTNVSSENVHKFSIYTVYYILKHSGYIFDFSHCIKCNSPIKEGILTTNGIYCSNCFVNDSKITSISKDIMAYLRTLNKPDKFKDLILTEDSEQKILNIFIKYIENICGKKIKSFEILKR